MMAWRRIGRLEVSGVLDWVDLTRRPVLGDLGLSHLLGRPKQICLHEAGHAVVAELVGVKVLSILVSPNDGMVIYEEMFARRWDVGLLAAAGAAVECAKGYLRWPIPRSGDMHYMEDALPSEDLRLRCMSRALSLVQKHMDVIERLASVLEQRDLIGYEVREIVSNRWKR